jgi:hypothetical protein
MNGPYSAHPGIKLQIEKGLPDMNRPRSEAQIEASRASGASRRDPLPRTARPFLRAMRRRGTGTLRPYTRTLALAPRLRHAVRRSRRCRLPQPAPRKHRIKQ